MSPAVPPPLSVTDGERLVELEALYRLTALLSGAFGIEEVGPIFLDQLCEEIGADAAALWLADPSSDGLEDAVVVGSVGFPTDQTRPIPTVLTRSLVNRPGWPHALTEEQSIQLTDTLGSQRPISSGVALCLHTGQRAVGALVVARTAGDPMSGATHRLLVQLAQHLAVTADHGLVYKELKHAREVAEQASHAKDEFMASMTHEIRTPMNGIVGMADVLGDSNLDEDQRHCVDVIRACSRSLLQLIDGLLDLSKLDANQVVLDRTTFDLRGVLETIADLVSASAGARNIEVANIVDPAIPDLVSGDAIRIGQIATNLLGNAVKFTDKGSAVMRTRVVGRREGRLWVQIQVADTGIGIEQDKLGAIFQRFTQADASTTRRFGGTGLGLAVAKQLAKMMGGDIAVASEPGEGSTFTATFPLDLPEDAADSARLTGTRVLIVDRHPTRRRLIAEQLALFGAQADRLADVSAVAQVVADAAVNGRAYDAVLDLNDNERSIPSRLQGLSSHDRPAVLNCARPGQTLMDFSGYAGHLYLPIRPTQMIRQLSSAIVERSTGLSAPPPRESARVRLLVADDSPVNLLVAVKTLLSQGFHVDTAENGMDAVDAVRRGQYDVVLMDMHMPGMDGLEATKAIRAMSDRRRTTPIIALTARSDAEGRNRCFEVGMNDYMTKPINRQELRKKVAQWSQQSCWSPLLDDETPLPQPNANVVGA